MLSSPIIALFPHCGSTRNSLAFARSVDLPIDDDNNHTAVIGCSLFVLGVTLCLLCSAKYCSHNMSLEMRLVRCVLSILTLSGWIVAGLVTFRQRLVLTALSTALAISVVFPFFLLLKSVLRSLANCIRSFKKLFWSSLASAVMLVVGMAFIGFAVGACCRIIHHRVGLVAALSTAMTMCFLVGIIAVVICFVLCCLVVLYRVAGKFSSWATRKMVQREPSRLDTKSVCAIPKEADKKSRRVRFAPSITVIIVERWNPGLGQDFLDMVVRNTNEVVMEQQEEKKKRAAAAAATTTLVHSACISSIESSSLEQSIEAVGDCSSNDDSVETMDWEYTPDPSPPVASFVTSTAPPMKTSRHNSFKPLLATIPESEEDERDEDPVDSLVGSDDDRNELEMLVKEEQQPVVEEEPAHVQVQVQVVPPALRRSSRVRKTPDRWVPPSGRTIKAVPVGSFYECGVRRSGRLAARMALP